MRTGITLIELVIVLAVTSVGLSLLVPAARSWSDRLAVVGAREALVGLLASTRARALAEGGASLVIDEASGSAWIQDARGTRDSVSLVRDFHTSMELVGSRVRSELRFDALGIGRVASQQIIFRKRASQARVVLSAYGGVSRR
jgi:Tfp pilus assembly protein FimT